MNIEFHYYIIHFLANQAGFPEEEAQLIAYSSQFVDHNIVSYRIEIAGKYYSTFPTQNYGFWDESLGALCKFVADASISWARPKVMKCCFNLNCFSKFVVYWYTYIYQVYNFIKLRV